MIKETGATVHGFDNTPGSNRYFERSANALAARAEYANFHRHAYLLSSSDGVLELDLPKGHRNSYTATATGSAYGFRGRRWTAPCRTLSSLMRMLNHTHLDVLKVDIESSEFAVFDELAAAVAPTPPVLRLPACQLLVEFHSRLHAHGYEAKAQTMLSLASLGFELVHNGRSSHGAADDAFLINPRFCHKSKFRARRHAKALA